MRLSDCHFALPPEPKVTGSTPIGHTDSHTNEEEKSAHTLKNDGDDLERFAHWRQDAYHEDARLDTISAAEVSMSNETARRYVEASKEDLYNTVRRVFDAEN